MWLKILPYIAAFVIGAGATIGIVKATKPTITTEVVDKTPCVCNCPAIPPSNGIDYDKIKNVRGLTIQNHQYYVVNNDTLSLEAITQAMRKVAEEQRLSRCK